MEVNTESYKQTEEEKKKKKQHAWKKEKK